MIILYQQIYVKFKLLPAPFEPPRQGLETITQRHTKVLCKPRTPTDSVAHTKGKSHDRHAYLSISRVHRPLGPAFVRHVCGVSDMDRASKAVRQPPFSATQPPPPSPHPSVPRVRAPFARANHTRPGESHNEKFDSYSEFAPVIYCGERGFLHGKPCRIAVARSGEKKRDYQWKRGEEWRKKVRKGKNEAGWNRENGFSRV
ncbi:hypothetical protein BOTBODRAFT_197645 [Botryobasidium botryosum FD-172 SS1]|uniref:Uncharacterized protein n=1 Tax=Botryobasidium botryosum (strain FD-172 SS1) TaxID=930990 RepID=A0A067N2U9_BOTB1|nr:hypothetical protein BOTBODRAFT_197645 [Botryobasidium botryosum FD-172 SS1]